MSAYRLLTSSRPLLTNAAVRFSRTPTIAWSHHNSLRVPTTNVGAVRHYTSPFQAFVDVLREQLKKNKDIQQNIKQLQDETGKIADSDTLRRAKEVFLIANCAFVRLRTSQEGTASTTHIGAEKIKQASETISKAASQVGETISQTLKEASEAEFVKETQEKLKKAGETVSNAAEPLIQNPVVGKISESVKTATEDRSGRYAGYIDKETRRKLREQAANGEQGVTHGRRSRPVEANPNAGSSMVMHKDSEWKASWNKFKENNSIMQGIFKAGKTYQESDNIFIAYSRAFTDRVQDTFGSLFEESDQAQAIKALQAIDPRFNMERFLREAREYIIPELMDAYLKGDSEILREWCSEASYNVLTAVLQAQLQQGLVSDCKILDLRDVDLVTAKILDNDVPVLVLSYRTQEVILFRNRVTQEIVYGKEDHIEQVTYACVLTILPENVQNPITGGWRVMEMAKHDSRPTW
ncbi:hypothetical protein BC937DRAFT_92448 [Endogone sp. FLAS-F59071]|nr:hypothetical protein BC937DRAFT_92448 [Endogone sp. FLAS-F59071]|eukprot:RUS21514.1 hypothetical protein BC937DRAFT_92448 [Endogone sp. FLAS-F59071]